MTVDQKFDEFKSKLEITEREEDDAITKHTYIREKIQKKISTEDVFLTGSYKRRTKIRPLKDVDMFVVYAEEFRDTYLSNPKKIISELRVLLMEIYGDHFKDKVKEQYHSVNIDFATIGFDVIPAFSEGNNYIIPDLDINEWIKTNPKVYAEILTNKNEENQKKLIPLIKMVKHWNQRIKKEQGKKPLKSFLIEVILVEAFQSPPQNFKTGVKIAFEFIYNNIEKGGFKDPAGLGPNIDSKLTSYEKQFIAQLAGQVLQKAVKALKEEEDGNDYDALRLWYEIFGDPFYNPDKDKPIRAGIRKRESKLPADSPNRRFGKDDE